MRNVAGHRPREASGDQSGRGLGEEGGLNWLEVGGAPGKNIKLESDWARHGVDRGRLRG